jgi:outer membrane lipoprotein LolB
MRRLGPTAVAALWLAGCATVPPPSPELLSGRIAVRVQASEEQAPRAFSAGFELRGGADAGELRLSSPLGTMLATARWSGAGAWLVTSAGETAFEDVDALSRAALGESLPLRALPDWLHGRPWAGAPSRASAQGFEQLGWRVGLAQFADGRIDAVREAPPVVTVRAQLDQQ